MLSFRTEFPVNQNKNSDIFLGTIYSWILGSPHTKFTQNTLGSISPINGTHEEKIIEEPTESKESLHYIRTKYQDKPKRTRVRCLQVPQKGKKFNLDNNYHFFKRRI